MDDVDPDLLGQILAKAFIVLSRAEFRAFRCHINGMTPVDAASFLNVDISNYYKKRKGALNIMKNEWGKRK